MRLVADHAVETKSPVLTVPGEQVVLRKFRWSDVSRYLIWAQEKEVQRYFAPILSSEDPRWLINLWRKPANDIMAILAPIGPSNHLRHIGGIGFQDIDRLAAKAEFGFAIGREEWRNQGYGTDALKALLRYAFGPLRLESVYARVLTTNARSLRVLEKTRFENEGICGEIKTRDGWTDLLLLRAQRDSWISGSGAG